MNYIDCVPLLRFPADPFLAVYNKTKHVMTPYSSGVSHTCTHTHQHSTTCVRVDILVLHAYTCNYLHMKYIN